ncbi:MAG: hypothetical protein ABI882_14350 [Acidobacteriota bacterium]
MRSTMIVGLVLAVLFVADGRAKSPSYSVRVKSVLNESGMERREPRVVKFPGGQATIESTGASEHIVVTGDDGKMRSESWCPMESGTYDQLSKFFKDFQTATKTGQADVLPLLRFPFRVNGGGGRTLTRVDDLKRQYRQVFTARVVKRIQGEEPAAVFCRNGQAMMGDGSIWVHAEGGVVKADVLNRW